MKTNFRTIFAALFAMMLMVFAMPQKAMAKEYNFSTKAYVGYIDLKGNVHGNNVGDMSAFTSKSFSGTLTEHLFNKYKWAWSVSSGLVYDITAVAPLPTSPTNATLDLPKPQTLWNYDSDKFEFLGVVSNSTLPNKSGSVSIAADKFSNTYGAKGANLRNNGEEYCYVFKEKAPQVTYTLNYNTKGGTPAIAAQTITNNTGSATFTISSTVPSKDGYNFLGWSATDGGAVAYNPGGSLTTSDENTTIYAVWERIPLPGNLTISCEGLQNGESAVIEVKNDDSQVLYRVSVSSDNPTVTIKGVKIGTYKVAPMHWSWTYETMDLQNVTIEEEQTASVSFTAVKKTSIEQKYDENKKVVK